MTLLHTGFLEKEEIAHMYVSMDVSMDGSMDLCMDVFVHVCPTTKYLGHYFNDGHDFRCPEHRRSTMTEAVCTNFVFDVGMENMGF